MTDPLRNLLHQADAAAPGPVPLPADLAPRICRRARQRRRRRAIVAALGIALPVIVAIVLLFRPSPLAQKTLVNTPPAPSPALPLSDPSPSLSTAPIAVASLAIDPVADLRDDAALTMVVIARRRARTLGPEDAATVYQRTIDLYPDTRWAAIARTELANLPHRKDPL
jgi:hypothetical protein